MKKIKNILFVAMFSLIMAVQTISASAAELSELQSGIYDIKNDVYHEQEIGMSMARQYLSEDMTLEKEDGKWYYIVSFSGTNYMNQHRILIDEKEVEFEVLEENEEDHTIKLKFETTKLSPDLSTQIYVDAMGRDVEFDIIPKEDTLNLVQAIEEPKEEVKAESTSEDKEENSNNLIFIGVGIVAVIVVAVFGLRKIRQ